LSSAAYLEMMLQVMALGHPLIVVECRAVAMRLGSVSTADDTVEAVVGVMDKLGVEEACVIGHSYGESRKCGSATCLQNSFRTVAVSQKQAGLCIACSVRWRLQDLSHALLRLLLFLQVPSLLAGWHACTASACTACA
jgi:hypothetical protein